jgi:pimeloyl-ACP methyl ester carboxylesterase
MSYARTDDRAKIYYEEQGRGAPVVLAYGIGGDTRSWDTNVAALAARFRVVLWDPRGHGRSDSPADPTRYSFGRWALDLRDLLDHLRIRRATVGGLSLGAGIATRFALRYPTRVRSLVVSDSASAAGVPLSHDDLIVRAQSIKVVLEQGLDAMAEFAMRANPNTVARVRLDPNAKAEVYAKYRELNAIGYANSVRALMGMDHITDRLPSIRVPTLLIAGDRDPSLPAMRMMHRKVRGSRLVIVPDASHFANREQPTAWNAAVLDFLDAHGNGTGFRRTAAAGRRGR